MTSYFDLILLSLAFATIVFISLAIILRIESGIKMSRRLSGQSLSGTKQSGNVSLRKSAKGKSLLTTWIEKSSSLADTKNSTDLATALKGAGFNNPNAPAIFIGLRFAAAILLPLLFLWLQPTLMSGLKQNLAVGGALVLTAIGLIAPRAIIDNIASNRQRQLTDAFPDTLDLMVVCVEAGLGMEAAFGRVGQEIARSRPLLSAELATLSNELRAGRSRADALRNFATRCNVDSITAFTTLMIQSDALGSSVGRTLRVYSTEMRTNRALIAEEKAARIPVLLTIPLVACILPVIATALLLPAVLMMKDMWSK